MRTRDTERWGIGSLYPNSSYFLGDHVGDGLHAIQFGNQLVDLLVRDRGSDTTVVVFHASVTDKTTFPIFSGESFTREAGVNLIALSDPGVAIKNELRLGWFIGTKQLGNFRKIATPIIKHLLDCLGSRRTILWGSSGGGYAAVNFAQEFPGEMVFAINPRLHLTARPKTKAAEFISTAYKTTGNTSFRRVWDTYVTDNLADLYPDGLAAHVGIYQNQQDVDYYLGQFLPFVQSFPGDQMLWVRTENDGDGHVSIPRDRMIGMVKAMSDTGVDSGEAMKNAGFSRPSA